MSTSDSIWSKLKEKNDTFIYGFAPFLFAKIAFSEAKAYESTL